MGRIRAFINCKVYRSFMPVRTAEAFIVSGDRISYVGGAEDVLRLAEALGAEVVDLDGKVVLPGFIDAHAHLDTLALCASAINLSSARSVPEILRALAEEAHKPGGWLLAYGWDEEGLDDGRPPLRTEVDGAVGGRPAVLMRRCFHMAVLSTAAIERAGLGEDTPGLDGERGVATGEALRRVREALEETLALSRESLMRTMEAVASMGVTTMCVMSCSRRLLRALMAIRETAPIRLRIYLRADGVEEAREAARIAREAPRSPYVRVVGVKVVADGSLGARTAWLTKPYSDDPGNSGAPSVGRDELREIVKEAVAAGLQPAVHGIGDRAVDMILDVYDEAGAVGRPRIEHASVVREDQLRRMARLGVAVCIQPMFVISDWWVLKRLGRERASMVYPFKSMLSAGVAVGIGSDAPIEDINPWRHVYAAVTRGRHEGIELYSHTPGEALGVLEALHCYTYGSAFVTREEELLGTIDAGKYADFVVVDRDPLGVDSRDLPSIRVVATYVGGRRVR
ncbi:amidohydrolase [Candidatus Geothermarchaeota archaeon ex4572_27]|nr:MAG: amidohydrolase [Candidatus Geothermarchaeota archaeon ex4572_27]